MINENAVKDGAVITQDWQVERQDITGVHCKEVLHVPRDHGVITEMYRPEWDPTGLPVGHCYQSRLFPGAIGAWSCHAKQIDRLFVNQGHMKVVMYDGREDSPTFGTVNEFHVGDTRPTFLVIPTGVWHGVQNLGAGDVLMLNFPTIAYQYHDPDHYRLPFDSDEIPYSWDIGVRNTARLRADAKKPRV
ncbi:dTDP-4-dehydrorhamnose 3,5-epimerase [Halioglobus maricola]|uniref:dTDP-4-dehydrorhamnose 3,5-epimerase n=1 Tax=Halioglobus maricola TaxID=2601894 RepID=A0A5P9NGK2_9GAMM|nr:dTDP-4-dehydrorhamnose 3,5-epimerase family protein [Halioglobus maricola]QFU74334.1 dTDP-4-dehydrorhamnose 3,5-epimerase [Halioglobus maricola]